MITTEPDNADPIGAAAPAGAASTGTAAESVGAVPATWVVGAGGLLGSAVVRALGDLGRPVLTRRIPWGDPGEATRALRAGIDELRALAPDGGWQVLWCAGSGVTGTSADVLESEVVVYERFLDDLAGLTGPGTIFLASSAGGVYAGSKGAPFTEAHEPAALSPYGHAKLRMEAATGRFTRVTGNPAAIGRIANLYGPGQDLAKGQGLISHLCQASLLRRPVGVFVSLDTIRDYFYVDDAAPAVLRLADCAAATGGTEPLVKILASGRGVTVASLLAECKRIFRRPPKVILGSSHSSRFQVRDLRLRSIVRPDLDRHPLTPLPVGIANTREDLRRRA